MLGQRLALARCNFSYKFAKERGWIKFVENSKNSMKGGYDVALTAALEQIGALKGQMNQLELENEDIAE